jgi:WD40 repeat protein
MLAGVPASERVVTVSADGRLRVWDAVTGRAERDVSHHAAKIECLAVMPDGARAITSSADGAFTSWSIATGEVLCKRDEDPDTRPGALFPQAGDKVLWRGRDDVWLHVWDARTGDAVDLEREDEDDDDRTDIEDAVLAPDGRTVVGVDGHNAVVWDLVAGGPAKEHALGGYGYPTLTPDARVVLKSPAEDFDPDRGTVGEWDVATGARIRSIAVDARGVHPRFDPSRRWFVRSVLGALEVWDVAAGKPLGKLEGGHPSFIKILAWSPDARLLATASDDANQKKDDRRPPWKRTGVVCLWDVEAGRRLGRWEAPSVVCGLAVTPGGRLVVGLYDGDVAFFSVAR